MPEARHLVLFLRAPQRGAVKRRLARTLGDRVAHRFYLDTSRDLIRRVTGDPRWRTVLAVTPDTFARRSRFWPGRPPRMAQGRGDLGRRMACVFEALPPGPVVIVGGDIPAIAPAHIAAAFTALARWQVVFGPAADGGYWLVGLARRRLDPRAFAHHLFRGVRWSGPHALADTRANLPQGAEAPPLATLDDMDDAAAYARWRGTSG